MFPQRQERMCNLDDSGHATAVFIACSAPVYGDDSVGHRANIWFTL